jgi:NIMA (never in mitosis gene a)-related kinase
VVPFHTLTPKQKKNALNEVRVLASIKHPNIIQYHQAFFDEVDEELCLVMELVNGGDLKVK